MDKYLVRHCDVVKLGSITDDLFSLCNSVVSIEPYNGLRQQPARFKQSIFTNRSGINKTSKSVVIYLQFQAHIIPRIRRAIIVDQFHHNIKTFNLQLTVRDIISVWRVHGLRNHRGQLSVVSKLPSRLSVYISTRFLTPESFLFLLQTWLHVK